MDIAPNITLTVLLLAISVLILLLILWKQRSYSSRKILPPEAGGAWPIIGHLPLLGGSQPPHITLGELAKKYGPIFTLRMGVHRALIVSSSEIAKECFTTNDKVFANRPKAVAAVEHMAYDYAMFGFSPYGPYWRQIRRIATLELLSNHRLQTLSHVRESEVKRAIKEIYNNSVTSSSGVDLEMKKWLGDITLNTVLRIAVGRRYGEAGSTDDRYSKAIRDFFELTGTFTVGDAIPWLRWLDVGGYEKAMKKTFKELDQVLQGWLEEHKRSKRSSVSGELGFHGADGGDAKGEQDFMDVMLSILDGAEEMSGYDADTINKATCLAFILAGTDSTTVTMTWALALLLNNRESMKKAQQELDQHVGRDRLVKDSDTQSLPYLHAILKETLRLYPALPLLAPHYSSEDCTVAGFHVAAGTRLLVNAAEIQRDPNVWSNPTEFDPDRFLTAHQNVDVRGQSYELVPFGSGRRMCPGISFSLQVMHLTLAYLLHGFEIETASDERSTCVARLGWPILRLLHLTWFSSHAFPPKRIIELWTF